MERPSTNTASPSFDLWDLPDVLLFRVVSFAAAPTERAAVLCHQLGPLCPAAHRSIFSPERSLLWDTVLREDYGVVDVIRKTKRRKCERLMRSAVERVRDAHQLMSTNTEYAFFHLSELIHGKNREGKKLSKAQMNRILDEFGPRLRVHRTVATGGIFLVELCRARNVAERTVLQCVQALVEERGAAPSVNMRTSESTECCETALCVAAARGMATVTKYLLRRGADPLIKSSGRFSLHTNKRQSVRCHEATVAEFVKAMIKAEQEAGATNASFKGLRQCLRMVENYSMMKDN